MENKLLMAHQVAGYPEDETAIAAAEALIAGGTGILEVQLAFSDPSADGVAIQTACSTVLSKGYTVKQGLEYISKIRKLHPEIPVFLMTYGCLVYRPGVENFVKMAHDAGVSGLIVPDLPFDCDEGLTAACKKYGMHNIPVAAPSMTEERLNKMATAGFKYIYTALRAGITGTKTVTIPAPRVQIRRVIVSMLPRTTVSFVIQVESPQYGTSATVYATDQRT